MQSRIGILMRVLTVHNFYGDGPGGGEDSVMNTEVSLLRDRGHDVAVYLRKNSEGTRARLSEKLRWFQETAWSGRSYHAILEQIRTFRPDIMHVHNFWFVLSPSIFQAARSVGVATVLTLHNYRLVCPGGMMMRNFKSCELCVGKNPWRILIYRCYRNSLAASIARYRMMRLSEKRGIWVNDIDAYIALSEFARSKFIAGGLPRNRLHVKANGIADPLDPARRVSRGRGAVYIGRLSPEKGVDQLLLAWKEMDYPLEIVGDGPLLETLRSSAPSSVTFTGRISHEEVFDHMERAAFMVFPSRCYEGFPVSVVESLAMGRPVIAPGHAALPEIIEDGVTGHLFVPGDVESLKDKILSFIRSPETAFQAGLKARETYLKRYTSDINYLKLMEIYQFALRQSRAAGDHQSDFVV
ncbi:glycosyltransferase [bacterium]|nr:glycosyltransferase [candidate division CSSED10-310 bacterium]